MEIDYPSIAVPATPEYVLSVIQDQHRQDCQFELAAGPDETLNFDTAVSVWLEARDTPIGWAALGRAPNDAWKIRCSREQWKRALSPPHRHALRDVCNLIAAHAKKEVIRPAHLLGAPCATAGAFLTVRSLLTHAGADADAITPSAPLPPFTRRYADIFLGQISRLAPGKLLPVRIDAPTHRLMGCGFLASLLATFLGGMLSAWVVVLVALPMTILFWIASWATSTLKPASVTFGELRTFRDLANLLGSS